MRERKKEIVREMWYEVKKAKERVQVRKRERERGWQEQ